MVREQPRWPVGTPGGGHLPGPGPGRWRGDGLGIPGHGGLPAWVEDWVDAGVPGPAIRLAGVIPPNNNRYENGTAPGVEHWARAELSHAYPTPPVDPRWIEEIDPGQAGDHVRSQVDGVNAFWRGTEAHIHVRGTFRADDYFDNREMGQWAVVIRTHTGGSEAEISSIGLDRWRRGQGVAGRWVTDLEQSLYAAGVRQIHLQDMSGGFWEHLGYVLNPRTGVSSKKLNGDWAAQISGRLPGAE